jgi:hypothetical protein
MGSRPVEYVTPNPIPEQYQGFMDWINQGIQSGANNQGAQMIQNWATTTNPTYEAGNTMLQNTLSGQYLSPDSNPWLQQTYDTAANNVMKNYKEMGNDIDTSMALNGLGYSTVRADQRQKLAESTGNQLSGMAANIYGYAYQNERNNQMNALSQGLNYANYPLMQGQALNSFYWQPYQNAMTMAGVYKSDPQQQQYYNPLSSYLGPLAYLEGPSSVGLAAELWGQASSEGPPPVAEAELLRLAGEL